MYVRDYANVTEQDIEQFVYENSSHVDLPPVTACTSWQFDDSIYTSTVVTEVRVSTPKMGVSVARGLLCIAIG